MLAAIPAIQPIDNQDLPRIAKGFDIEFIQFIKLEKCTQE